MRRAAALTMVVLAAVLLAGAAIAWYADAALVDDQEFATRVTSSLDDENVRGVVADQLVTGLTSSAVPNALIVRPLIVPLVAVAADAAVFRRTVHRALASRHRALVRGDTTFSLQLPLGEGTLFEGLRRFAPSVARRIPADLRIPVLRLDPKGFELTAAHLLVSFAGWRWPLLVAGVLAALGCAVLAGGVRAALIHVGLAIAGGGLLVAAIVAGLGDFVATHAAHAANLDEDAEHDAISACLGRAVRRPARRGAGSGARRRARGGHRVGHAARRGPRAGWRRVQRASDLHRARRPGARGAALVAVGAALVVEPALLGRIAVVVGGVLLVVVGLAQLPAVRPPGGEAPPPRAARARGRGPPRSPSCSSSPLTGVAMAPRPPRPARGGGPRRRRAGRMQRSARDVRAPPGPGRVRRHAQLLRRRGRARVAVRQPALRDRPPAARRDPRAARRRPPGRARPRTGASARISTAEGSDRNKVAQELSPAALRAADRLVGRAGVGKPVGRRRPYLCHTLCELGAEPLDEQLGILRRFLAANPREVVLLFVEPYVPVATMEKALRDADLLTRRGDLPPCRAAADPR